MNQQMFVKERQLIAQLNLSMVHRQLVTREGWQPDCASQAIAQYKNYLFLRLKYAGQYQLPPSHEVDEVWHAHILHTQAYMTFCYQVFGYYLHHEPTQIGNKMGELFKTTQNLYYKEFSEYLYRINKASMFYIVKKFFEKVKH